jgi:hypothetical protein
MCTVSSKVLKTMLTDFSLLILWDFSIKGEKSLFSYEKTQI